METPVDDGRKKAAANLYKALKENFYANHSGGTATEINVVTAVAATSYILYALLQTRRNLFSPSADYGVQEFFLDYLLNVGGLLLSITLYSSNSAIFNVALLVPAVLLYFSSDGLPRIKARKPASVRVEEPAREKEKDIPTQVQLPRRAYLTTYRGGMMVITCLAILAVDFRVFPRRFAKVETWGTSLMDMGVGSFVYSAGLVSAGPVLKNQLAGNRETLFHQMAKSFRSSLALLVLGFVRLAVTKGADYHEHITEYGRHWNFFFTLGFQPPFVALFTSLMRTPSPTLLFGISIILSAGYEILLNQTSLTTWILTAPRDNIIAANKEGIASFIGYLSLFLAGQALGLALLKPSSPPPPPPPQNSTTRESSKPDVQRGSRKTNQVFPLLQQAILWTLIYLACTNYPFGFNLRVSRRIANLPYVAWVGMFNCWQILAFWAVERAIFGSVDVGNTTPPSGNGRNYEERTSRILRAFNKNGLVVFLVANIFTGLVNKSIDTLKADDRKAMGILFMYSLVLSALAVATDRRTIRLKL